MNKIGRGRRSTAAVNWSLAVQERDGWKCQHCGLDDKSKLQAHHVIPWIDSIDLRFVVDNGLTLCRSCHTKEDRRIKPVICWSKGKKFTDEHKKKLSDAHKGKDTWNKGKTMTPEYSHALSISRIGKPSKKKGKSYGFKGKKGWVLNEITGKRDYYDK